VVQPRVRRRHLPRIDHPFHEHLGPVEERAVLQDQHPLVRLAGHQVPDLPLLQHPHVEERGLGGEDVRHPVLVEER
jgi:hypothetical protein